MTKTKYFDIFGIHYRTVQFPAIPCLAALGHDLPPDEALQRTEVKTEAGWVRLDNREAINAEVKDILGIMPPLLVLRGVMKVVHDFSFEFASQWRGQKIPSRFQSKGEVRSSTYTQPMIAQILTENMATLRELEEYYSLEDAFKMFDVIVVRSINSALATEAATRK